MVTIAPVVDVHGADDVALAMAHDVARSKAILDALMSPVRQILSFMVVGILLEAQRYHDRYRADLGFDNRYVTEHFRRVDGRRRQRGAKHLLPLRRAERLQLVEVCVYVVVVAGGRVHALESLDFHPSRANSVSGRCATSYLPYISPPNFSAATRARFMPRACGKGKIAPDGCRGGAGVIEARWSHPRGLFVTPAGGLARQGRDGRHPARRM